MNAEVVNEVLNATKEVLGSYFSITVTKNGDPRIIKGESKIDNIMVILGITGDIEGQVIFGYSDDTALGIARAMMGAPDHPTLDDMCKSALSELGNMVAGMSSTGLSSHGFLCNISPPTVLSSSDGSISIGTLSMICLPLATNVGDFSVSIGMKPG